MHAANKQVKEKHNKKNIIRKVRKYFEINKNRNQQNLWDAAKSVLKGNLWSICKYIH